MVGNLHDLNIIIFGIKQNPYSVLLVIATNIPVLLMTAFVLQSHVYYVNITVYSGCDYS